MSIKEEPEQEFHSDEKQKQSGVGTAALVVILVLLLVLLGVLLWQLGSKLLQRRASGLSEGTVTEISEENEEESALSAGSSFGSGETENASGSEESGEAGSESGNGNSSGGDSQTSSGNGEAQSETGQEGSSGEDQGDNSGGGQEDNSSEGSGEPGSADGENSQAAGQTTGQTTGNTSQDGSMTFTAVDETVTAKSATNLRSEPSTSGTDTVVTVLESGMQAQRTGINEDTGWSRLSYEGQTLYAVSSLLTTDLSGQTTGEAAADPDRVTTQDGRVIIFTACDDTVSPKMSTNLRTEPSTSQGNATVYYELQYGETVHRTGYDGDAGWSRVEYDGQVLYAVTSYLYVVE